MYFLEIISNFLSNLYMCNCYVLLQNILVHFSINYKDYISKGFIMWIHMLFGKNLSKFNYFNGLKKLTFQCIHCV